MIITQITLITVLGTDIRQNFYKSFAFSILLAYTYICYILRKDFVITMSDFSQRLEKEIHNTGKTLCYLAEASGLQLDYISKMNKGKRIPKEEDRLVRLLDAMECTAGTKSDLLLLYRQEKMGKSQWQCMEELIRTRSGNFTWEDSMTLAEVEDAVKDGTIEDRVIRIGQVLKDYPEIFCTREGDRLLENGNALTEYFVKGSHKEGWVRMCDSQGEFKGIYQWDEAKNRYQPQKMFL